jgi:hypothetical protein
VTWPQCIIEFVFWKVFGAELDLMDTILALFERSITVTCSQRSLVEIINSKLYIFNL